MIPSLSIQEPKVKRNPNKQGIREKLYIIIFGHDTWKGKYFDIVLLLFICVSIVVVMLDSVASIREQHGRALFVAEWGLTSVFAVEYMVRVYAAPKRRAYMFSFLGVVDLLSILPTFLSLLFTRSEVLLTIRALRLLRVFSVLKLSMFLQEANSLAMALQASARKIVVFLVVVVTLAVIMGSFMYIIEGANNGFTSIPKSVYWAIVTMTTVGYGDIAPHTVLGQMFATIVMILGYGIIAVPTGIVSVEYSKVGQQELRNGCSSCLLASHEEDAVFCKICGSEL